MIFRFSNYLSHAILLFISLSLASILYIGIFYPSTKLLLSYSDDNAKRSKLASYTVSYLYSNNEYSFFYNSGDYSIEVESLFLDPVGYYNDSIFIYHNGRWLKTGVIPPHTIFRLGISSKIVSHLKRIIIFTKEGMISVNF